MRKLKKLLIVHYEWIEDSNASPDGSDFRLGLNGRNKTWQRYLKRSDN